MTPDCIVSNDVKDAAREQLPATQETGRESTAAKSQHVGTPLLRRPVFRRQLCVNLDNL